MEWITLWGWMTTVISSGVTEKRCIASINSRPLFIIVALSTEILAPMLQLGWRTACSGVTSSSSARAFPRKGPPEPVSRILCSSPGARPIRHWKMAECSESTGMISAPLSRARCITSVPAQTRVSLFARAMRFFSSMAASVGRRPTAPETAVTTQSLSASVAASIRPSMPEPTRISVSATAILKRRAASSSYTATKAGFKRRACSSSRSILRWAVRAATRRPRCSAAAMVCRPMEPVLPRTEMALTMLITSIFYRLRGKRDGYEISVECGEWSVELWCPLRGRIGICILPRMQRTRVSTPP